MWVRPGSVGVLRPGSVGTATLRPGSVGILRPGSVGVLYSDLVVWVY